MSRIAGVIVVVILHGLAVINGVPLKPCSDDVEWVPDLDDCSVYHLCAGGIAQEMTCKDGFSFQPDYRVCVPKGSQYDTCEYYAKQHGLCSVFLSFPGEETNFKMIFVTFFVIITNV